MLVTFRSKAWGNVTLFGDAAARLLEMMGHSGTVPSAMRAEDVPDALARLKREIASVPEEKAPPDAQDNPDNEPPVSLRKRAYPLIELLEASARKRADVMWDEGVPIP